MGDRITIKFVSEYDDDAPELYSHWGGRDMINAVEKFMKNSSKTIFDLECGTVMVLFIRWLGNHPQYKDMELTLVNDDCADYSDNGLWIYDLDKMKWR